MSGQGDWNCVYQFNSPWYTKLVFFYMLEILRYPSLKWKSYFYLLWTSPYFCFSLISSFQGSMLALRKPYHSHWVTAPQRPLRLLLTGQNTPTSLWCSLRIQQVCFYTQDVVNHRWGMMVNKLLKQNGISELSVMAVSRVELW